MRRSSAARDRLSASDRPLRTSAWNQLSMPRVRNSTENANTSSSGATARPPNIRIVRPRRREPGTWRRQSRMKSVSRLTISASSTITPAMLIRWIHGWSWPKRCEPSAVTASSASEATHTTMPMPPIIGSQRRIMAARSRHTSRCRATSLSRTAGCAPRPAGRRSRSRRARACRSASPPAARRAGKFDAADARERVERVRFRRVALVRVARPVDHDIALRNGVVVEHPAARQLDHGLVRQEAALDARLGLERDHERNAFGERLARGVGELEVEPYVEAPARRRPVRRRHCGCRGGLRQHPVPMPTGRAPRRRSPRRMLAPDVSALTARRFLRPASRGRRSRSHRRPRCRSGAPSPAPHFAPAGRRAAKA